MKLPIWQKVILEKAIIAVNLYLCHLHIAMALMKKRHLKISASFGGGMGRMREVCGCMSAMALVAGFESGCTTDYNPKGKEKNYEMVQHLAQEFKKDFRRQYCMSRTIRS